MRKQTTKAKTGVFKAHYEGNLVRINYIYVYIYIYDVYNVCNVYYVYDVYVYVHVYVYVYVYIHVKRGGEDTDHMSPRK